MAKFTKDSFDVVSVTDIHRDSLLPGVLEELRGRETMEDVEFNEQLYCGDVFETIASEWAQFSEEDKQIFRIRQNMIEQVDNLAEIIETELVRIIAI